MSALSRLQFLQSPNGPRQQQVQEQFSRLQPPSAPAAALPLEILYQSQLSHLYEMGFVDFDANIRALAATNGDVDMAVEELIRGRGGE